MPLLLVCFCKLGRFVVGIFINIVMLLFESFVKHNAPSCSLFWRMRKDECKIISVAWIKGCNFRKGIYIGFRYLL